MNKIIRLAAVLLSLATAAAWFGGNAYASAKGKRIALLGTTNAQPFMGAWAATLTKDAEAAGMKVTDFSAKFDAALQSQQMDDAIAQKFDVILLTTINAHAILPSLIRAKKAGVPVILIVNPGEASDAALFTSYVGVDSVTLGRLAGENLVKGLAAEGKTHAQVAAVTGITAQLSTQERMKGFRAVLAKHPGIKLVAVDNAFWNTAKAEKMTGDLLVRYSGRGGLDAIYGMSDNMANGAIQAIQSAGLKIGVKNKGILVISSNCMKIGIQNIRAGLQYSTNTQIPAWEAKRTTELLVRYFNGHKLKKYEIVPSYAVTRANVDKYAAACSY